MTLDKLHKNEVAGIGTVAWPYYMVFKERLILKKFEEIKTTLPLNSNLLKVDLEDNGLLCPMVINYKNKIVDGSARFALLSEAGVKGSLFYQARNKDEEIFFKKLNNLIWDEHPDMTKLMEKLWQGKLKKYTEKVTNLFTENVKTVIPK
jgi:hypothetical protein|tara:strand:+ start:63 stop:509 length:447 start_codon:yes stop_codon:yes gene_type:complete